MFNLDVVTPAVPMKTRLGSFKVRYARIDRKEYICLSVGNITKDAPIVRFQSACVFAEAFHSLECDCSEQLTAAMKAIQAAGNGLVIYARDEEGRGAGLQAKIAGMYVEKTVDCNSYEAYTRLGFDKTDYRDYRGQMTILERLDVAKCIHFIGNSDKRTAIERAGFVIVGDER